MLSSGLIILNMERFFYVKSKRELCSVNDFERACLQSGDLVCICVSVCQIDTVYSRII